MSDSIVRREQKDDVFWAIFHFFSRPFFVIISNFPYWKRAEQKWAATS